MPGDADGGVGPLAVEVPAAGLYREAAGTAEGGF
jgi:hypothetical protein